MAKFVALLASGLSFGMLMALVAMGFLLLYKATGVINFAHGDLVTLGAYLAVWATVDLGLPTIWGYLLALALMFVVGLLIERIAYAPLRRRSQLVVVISTLAAALVIRALISLWQGSNPRQLANDQAFPGAARSPQRRHVRSRSTRRLEHLRQRPDGGPFDQGQAPQVQRHVGRRLIARVARVAGFRVG